MPKRIRSSDVVRVLVVLGMLLAIQQAAFIQTFTLMEELGQNFSGLK